MTSVPSAASYAATVAAASVPPMRAVVRVLYRALLREAQQYGKLASQTQQTVQHEIDRLMPTQHSTAGATAAGGGKSVQISAIPIGSSSAPVIAFAISAISTPDALQSLSSSASSSTSSSPAASSFLSSSSFSFSATDVMTASIAHRLLREQFVLHLHEQRAQQLQKLVSTGFTALRKMKDRRAMLSAAIAAKAAAPSQQLLPISASSSSSAFSPITPLISSSSSVVAPPQLQSLSTAATSSSAHTRIHIVTNYVMSLHSQRPSAPAAASSLSPAYLSLSGAGGGTSHLYQYTVSITNTHPSQAIQLMSRHLLFTDSRGQRQEVTGDGVLGQQPVMQPAATHVYSSSVNIADRRGVMEGRYAFRLLPTGKTGEKEAEGRRGGRGAAGGRAGAKGTARGRAKVGRVEGVVKGSEEEAAAVSTDAAVPEGSGAGDETKAEAGAAEGEKDSSSSDEFEANFGPVLLTTNDSEQDRR